MGWEWIIALDKLYDLLRKKTTVAEASTPEHKHDTI